MRHSHRQALVQVLEKYGLDEREVFIFSARAGFESDGVPMTHAAIERFGYAITRQRVFSIIKAILRRMSDGDTAALKSIAPAILECPGRRLSPVDRDRRAQRSAIGKMRRHARTLTGPLNYGAVLKLYGVAIPERRSKTAFLLDPEASMIALHEDFRMRAACGWRICVKCKQPRRDTEYYVGNRGGGALV
ncbi:MAG: hypothetical protein HXY18_05185 [Bryobacteraceae bacterium]|nr:hypothetical protein [Bryobacteraceae bacterium]